MVIELCLIIPVQTACVERGNSCLNRIMTNHRAKEVSEIFETLPETGEDFETAKTKLNLYFDPKKNVEFEIYTF